MIKKSFSLCFRQMFGLKIVYLHNKHKNYDYKRIKTEYIAFFVS